MKPEWIVMIMFYALHYLPLTRSTIECGAPWALVWIWMMVSHTTTPSSKRSRQTMLDRTSLIIRVAIMHWVLRQVQQSILWGLFIATIVLLSFLDAVRPVDNRNMKIATIIVEAFIIWTKPEFILHRSSITIFRIEYHWPGSFRGVTRLWILNLHRFLFSNYLAFRRRFLHVMMLETNPHFHIIHSSWTPVKGIRQVVSDALRIDTIVHIIGQYAVHLPITGNDSVDMSISKWMNPLAVNAVCLLKLTHPKIRSLSVAQIATTLAIWNETLSDCNRSLLWVAHTRHAMYVIWMPACRDRSYQTTVSTLKMDLRSGKCVEEEHDTATLHVNEPIPLHVHLTCARAFDILINPVGTVIESTEPCPAHRIQSTLLYMIE